MVRLALPLFVSCAISTAQGWSMTPVKSIQARVQSGKPVWTNGTYLAAFGKTLDEKYRGFLDTVNTASVEGALMYVQAEGIAPNSGQNCQRKNNMGYVWFFETIMVQTNYSLAEYGDNTGVYPEYCKFAAMDSGKCTPSADNSFPAECNQFNGDEGEPNIGPCVGGEARVDNPLAPYKDNIWFSYPNSCPKQTWTDKTQECRDKYGGGLCPQGVLPDGVNCTFSYKILGYVAIDEVVGITQLQGKNGELYKNHTEFCKDGQDETKLDFWLDPLNVTANDARSQKLIDVYQKQVANKTADASTGEVMTQLPAMVDLVKANPPCYKNSKLCAKAKNGCRRTLLAQVCKVCDQPGEGCEVNPTLGDFPDLKKAIRVPVIKKITNGNATGSSHGSGSSSITIGDKPSDKANGSKATTAPSRVSSASTYIFSTISFIIFSSFAFGL